MPRLGNGKRLLSSLGKPSSLYAPSASRDPLYIEAVRIWEACMAEGRDSISRAKYEHALRAFNSALSVCTSDPSFPSDSDHKRQVFAALGETNRRIGRFTQALDAFNKAALSSAAMSPERATWIGSLGVVYLHLGRLQDAKEAFTEQYTAAKQLRNDHEMCRAIGNLGAVSYRLYLSAPEPRKPELLETAIIQLNERIDLARRQLAQRLPPTKEGWRIRYPTTTWLLVGLSRLSLCYTQRREHGRAAAAAREGLEIAFKLNHSTLLGFSRFFYGRALMQGGQPPSVYLSQFHPADGASPAAALCKEPSEENRGYLRELVQARADMNIVDEHGYTALDYAVFADDVESERIVLDGISNSLRAKSTTRTAALEGVQNRLQTESRVRKAYRELFQDTLRPVLLAHEGAVDTVARLRQVYAAALEANGQARDFFDPLRYIKYTDFRGIGRLPRSSENLAQAYEAQPASNVDYLIFVSYRWINKNKRAASPDDQHHTQYQRMVTAVEELLSLHPEISRDKLGIWMDFTCVDQDNPATGVNALPLIITQCNAIISLSDEAYYSRAWCCVEVLIAQAITRSYKIHRWYEHVQGDNDVGRLRPGPEIELSIADKGLTNETDRSAVLFLERQSKLLA